MHMRSCFSYIISIYCILDVFLDAALRAQAHAPVWLCLCHEKKKYKFVTYITCFSSCVT